METIMVIGVAGVMVIGIGIWFIVKIRWVDRRIVEAEEGAAEIIQAAEKEAQRTKKEKLVEAKEHIVGWRSEAEKEAQDRQRALNELERRLSRKEDSLESKDRSIRHKEGELENRLKEIRSKEENFVERDQKLGKMLPFARPDSNRNAAH